LITVDRPAREGDRVEVDFEIRPAGSGTKIAGGESKNHPVVIGQKRFIPGFEEALSGMKSGERKSFTLLAPGDWREKQFAGKALDFTAVMRLVQERRIPEENDEFAKGLSDFSTIDTLRSSVREGLLNEKMDKERQRIRRLIISEIAKEAKMELPEVLVEAEIDKMIAELKTGVAQMRMQWNDYLLHIGKTDESMRSYSREEALPRTRIALALREIALRENIDPSEERIAERANQILVQFKNAQEADTAIDPGQLREYTKGVLRNEKVFEFLESV
jgi:trigger factor